MLPRRNTTRATVRAALLTIAVAASLWAIWLMLAGGFIATIGGLRIRSNNPARVLLLAAIAAGGYFLLGGTIPVARLIAWTKRAARILASHPGALALLLATGLTVVATSNATRMASGADAYGYVSQADLWRKGTLSVPQPWVAEVPWPDAKWTFTPLGYRPVDREGDWSIVPTYSPGLPMLFAVAKGIGGQCVMFGVVPILAGLTALATYGIGRRLRSPAAGLIATWLVVTSPITLSSSLEPLTDAPVMAMWTLALYFILGTSRVSALAAGASAGLATLIRPNLAPLAVPLGLWLLCRRDLTGPWVRTRLVPALGFAAATMAGIAAVATINHQLYGSVATSGYGRLEDQVAVARMWPNLRRYTMWLTETHTVIPLLGLVPLAVPLRRFWPAVPDRTIFAVLAGVLIYLWGFYSAYLEFDSWGYLRFLLPGWPLIAVGLASLAVWLGTFGPAARWITGTAIVALGIWTTTEAIRRDVFEQRQAARHEAPIGRLVMAHTPTNSVLLTFERSGSMRYYAGRITLRYDLLHPEWLDRAVTWLTARGVPVYAVLDRRQAEEVKLRFSTQHTTKALDHPVVVYEPAGTALFALSEPRPEGVAPEVITQAFPDAPHCDPPVPLAPLVLRP